MRCYANVSRHLIAQHDTPRSAGDLIHNVIRSDIENSLKKETKEPTVTNPRPSIKRSRGLHALPSSTHNFRISETTPRHNDIFHKKKIYLPECCSATSSHFPATPGACLRAILPPVRRYHAAHGIQPADVFKVVQRRLRVVLSSTRSSYAARGIQPADVPRIVRRTRVRKRAGVRAYYVL
jgi:hypothetical protein